LDILHIDGPWIVFFAIIAVLLAVDFLVLNRQTAHKVSLKEAGIWSSIWVGCALLFNAGLWWYFVETAGHVVAYEKAMAFFAGYLIEKALSVDNMFVFLLIFNMFRVPAEYQRRILTYGVIGAIVFRTLLILFGVWLVTEFHWILYLFGFFLVITAVKMFMDALRVADKTSVPKSPPMLAWLQKHLRVTEQLHGEKFMVRQQGLYYATPLLVVLLLIEFSDLVFAVDSIPAIFAITTDPFIVVTSNIFAILGLRSLYFLLANMASRFYLLKYGLAVILLFVGLKMLVVHWFTIPIAVSLIVIALILTVCIVFQKKES
jgi:tellurite resistance protein TerC